MLYIEGGFQQQHSLSSFLVWFPALDVLFFFLQHFHRNLKLSLILVEHGAIVIDVVTG